MQSGHGWGVMLERAMALTKIHKILILNDNKDFSEFRMVGLANRQDDPSGDFAFFHAGEDGVDVFQGLGFDIGFHQA